MKYYPFAFWLFFLCIGIFASNQYAFNVNILWGLIISAILILLVLLFLKRKTLFSIFSCVFCIVLGALSFENYNRNILSEIAPIENSIMKIDIAEVLKPSDKYFKYKTKIIEVTVQEDSVLKNQNLLLYIPKKFQENFTGQELWLRGSVSEIESPKNPHQFNYKEYMLRGRVGVQMFSDSVLMVENPNGSLNYKLSVFKSNFKKQLKEKGFSESSRIFIQALALGDRMDMDTEWRQKLSVAGVSHLFAISGLHVVIIYELLFLILYPILFLKHGRNLRIILSLILIWGYAWFVGATPSVVRSAFMLSFYSVGFLMQRHNNLFHTLAFTAFVLLLINPNNLFDVGFQLSYSAVFFIVWYAKLLKPLKPKLKGIKSKIYDILLLTTSVQLGVLPIIIFYFHQFSWLFLFGNLIFLPLAMLLVVLSFITLLLIATGFWCDLFTNVINLFFGIFNAILNLSAYSDIFVVKNIHWNRVQILVWFVGFIFLPFLILRFSFRKLSYLISLVVIFELSGFYDLYQSKQKQQFIIFNQYKESVIAYRNGLDLHVFTTQKDKANLENYTINPFVTQEEIRNVKYFDFNEDFSRKEFNKTKNLIAFKNKLLVINPQKEELPKEINYILGSKGKFNQDLKLKENQLLILDASNYKSLAEKLQKEKPLYYTQQKGSFIIE
ncbi:ComEC family competence protein [Weeksellaceae bacterium TAE3-ERU29]|nr:ComEC family competence protein [Weeksellaceae bacterium TAE3-ERU29]